jgi:hypothetical protein
MFLDQGNGMTKTYRLISKDDAANVMRRVGIPAARRAEILRQLPDPIDLDGAQPVFVAYGVTLGELLDRIGASP